MRGSEMIQKKNGAVKIDSAGVYYKDLNATIRNEIKDGARHFELVNINGQRYIADAIKAEVTIDIYGTPGQDMGAFMNGPIVRVHNNAQDGVGNTMDDGEVIVEGRAGDVLGFSMRGGEIYVRNGCGYRTALHMKEYDGKRPVLVVGGITQDFLGEYMAGGIVIILDLEGQTHKANFIGTGMHGGVIYLRGSVDKSQVGDQVEISPIDEADRAVLDDYISRFLERFPDIDKKKDEILNSQFVKLAPRSKRPYSNLYAY
jgi:glutamate synthase domain-containing protein 3